MAILSFVELNPNHNQKSNKDYVNIRYVERTRRVAYGSDYGNLRSIKLDSYCQAQKSTERTRIQKKYIKGKNSKMDATDSESFVRILTIWNFSRNRLQYFGELYKELFIST